MVWVLLGSCLARGGRSHESRGPILIHVFCTLLSTNKYCRVRCIGFPGDYKVARMTLACVYIMLWYQKLHKEKIEHLVSIVEFCLVYYVALFSLKSTDRNLKPAVDVNEKLLFTLIKCRREIKRWVVYKNSPKAEKYRTSPCRSLSLSLFPPSTHPLTLAFPFTMIEKQQKKLLKVFYYDEFKRCIDCLHSTLL